MSAIILLLFTIELVYSLIDQSTYKVKYENGYTKVTAVEFHEARSERLLDIILFSIIVDIIVEAFNQITKSVRYNIIV